MEVLKSLDLCTPTNPRIVFGSLQERQLLPTLPYAAPCSRLGILLNRDSRPKLGPGRYPIDECTGFIHLLDQRTRSSRGVMFGATTEPRLPKDRRDRVPSPGRHQSVPLVDLRAPRSRSVPGRPASATSKPPFSQASDRFYDPRRARETACTPGVGTYRPEECVMRRKLHKLHSFGGKTKLVPSINVKCVVTNEDMCNICEQRPCGDYYENGKHHLCRACYLRLSYKTKQHTPSQNTTYSRQYLTTFQKVRDCGEIHQHENTDAALKLKSNLEIRNLRDREAYLSLYF